MAKTLARKRIGIKANGKRKEKQEKCMEGESKQQKKAPKKDKDRRKKARKPRKVIKQASKQEK